MTRWRRLGGPATLAGLAAWVLWWSIVNGRAEQRTNTRFNLGAAPLVGRDELDGWVWRFGWGLAGAAAVALVVVAGCWRGWWWRVRLRWVVLAASIGAAAFATLLALTDGADGLRYGAEHKTEYLSNLSTAPAAGEFVRTFIARIDRYSVHGRGHPPGFILLLKFLDAAGLRGVWPVVSLSIVATGVTAAAVLIAVRAVAGDEWMRRAAPVLVVAPYALWMATSGDAVYTAVGALGVAAVAEGTRSPRRAAVWFGVVAGLLFGSLLFVTYLGSMLLVLPAVLLARGLHRREHGAWLVTAGGLVGAVVVVGAFWKAGFWWFDGVNATRKQYYAGSAGFRPWSYFKIGNLGAALFAVGPVTVLGLGTLRDRRMWLLAGGATVALVASHLTRYTKGEVERIWLIFFPWLAISAAAFVVQSRRWSGAAVVAVQAAWAIVLQAALVSKW